MWDGPFDQYLADAFGYIFSFFEIFDFFDWNFPEVFQNFEISFCLDRLHPRNNSCDLYHPEILRRCVSNFF